MMSMLDVYSSKLTMSLTLGLSLSLVGCQSLPQQPHLAQSKELSERVNAMYTNKTKAQDEPITPNSRLDSGIEDNNVNTETDDTANANNDTDLVAAISEQNKIHPDLSGYHPIVTGANAFASRSILTDMATRNIDAQYYIWHDDQAGQLLLKDLWEAAERGVIVRLLIDDFNSSAALDQQLLRFSSHPNTAVRIVNPLMHRKLSLIHI